jgi:hypothetical protein
LGLQGVDGFEDEFVQLGFHWRGGSGMEPVILADRPGRAAAMTAWEPTCCGAARCLWISLWGKRRLMW